MDHKTDILNSGLVPMVVEQTPRVRELLIFIQDCLRKE